MIDTSKKYQDMCEKAKEIQDLWKPEAWDYVICLPLQKKIQEDPEYYEEYASVQVLSGYTVDMGYYGHAYGTEGSKTIPLTKQFICTERKIIPDYWADHIWMPRQDQIFDMLDASDLGRILSEIRYTWMFNAAYYPFNPQTMNQLLLMHAMKIRFNKYWKDNQWKKF